MLDVTLGSNWQWGWNNIHMEILWKIDKVDFENSKTFFLSTPWSKFGILNDKHWKHRGGPAWKIWPRRFHTNKVVVIRINELLKRFFVLLAHLVDLTIWILWPYFTDFTLIYCHFGHVFWSFWKFFEKIFFFFFYWNEFWRFEPSK